MTLKEASSDRNNNLNLIRLVASLLVLYMHAFAVSLGNESADLIGRITLGKEYAGGLAVDIFFLISGFLICKSYDRKKSIASFFKARFLRIWPLLFVVIMLLAFVMGPIMTTFTLKDYFAFYKHILYFLRNLFFVSAYTSLPGVFMDHYYSSVNGSLWTLAYEVICYFLVAATSKLWQKNKIWTTVLAGFFAIVYLIETYICSFAVGPISNLFISNMSRFGLYFAMGMIFYLYSERIRLDIRLLILGIVIVILGVLFLDFTICFSIGGACIVFYLGFQKHFIANWYNKIGDLSYGIYLLSFPIQQLVVDYFHKIGPDLFVYMDPYINMILSLIFVLPLSYLSWRFIESPCLKLKDKTIFVDR